MALLFLILLVLLIPAILRNIAAFIIGWHAARPTILYIDFPKPSRRKIREEQRRERRLRRDTVRAEKRYTGWLQAHGLKDGLAARDLYHRDLANQAMRQVEAILGETRPAFNLAGC